MTYLGLLYESQGSSVPEAWDAVYVWECNFLSRRKQHAGFIRSQICTGFIAHDVVVAFFHDDKYQRCLLRLKKAWVSVAYASEASSRWPVLS